MKLPFEERYRKMFYKHLDDVFNSNQWSDGDKVKKFEEKFSEYINIPSLAVSSGGAALLSIFEYLNVKDADVIVPNNTFWATAVAPRKAGARIIYADCNKYDLCISLDDVKKKVTSKTKVVVVVHIGGHIAFDIESMAQFCKEREIYLIEDCAHAHGAVYKGKKAGSWGFAGAYSFYATKTMPLGEGGMVCSQDRDFLSWLKLYRNYGKEIVDGKVNYKINNGFNFRMSEFSAALGLVEMERLERILAWKRQLAKKYDVIFENRIKIPDDMVSGYYKYIVFDYALAEETGQVFGINDQGTSIDIDKNYNYNELPNSKWIAGHHKCVPIYFGWEKADWPIEKLKAYIIQD
jgi:dTDP-4-amino-4,6-dideoxygalactose transaminase